MVLLSFSRLLKSTFRNLIYANGDRHSEIHIFHKLGFLDIITLTNFSENQRREFCDAKIFNLL